MHVGLTFTSTNDGDRHTASVCVAKRPNEREEEIRKKNAGNSGDGYLSKSKMPEISMKRLRNATLFCSFFHFAKLHISRFTLTLNDTQTIHICYVYFSSQTNGSQSLTHQKNSFLFIPNHLTLNRAHAWFGSVQVHLQTVNDDQMRIFLSHMKFSF